MLQLYCCYPILAKIRGGRRVRRILEQLLEGNKIRFGPPRFSCKMANFGGIPAFFSCNKHDAISVKERLWEARFGEMTEASDYYQNPEFHKPVRRNAGVVQSAVFAQSEKANFPPASLAPHIHSIHGHPRVQEGGPGTSSMSAQS